MPLSDRAKIPAVVIEAADHLGTLENDLNCADLILGGEGAPPKYEDIAAHITDLRHRAYFPSASSIRITRSVRNKTAISPTYNNAASGSLIRGAFADEAIDKYLALFWAISDHFNITVWIERLVSASNIADLPTRNNPSPTPDRAKREFGPWGDRNQLDKAIFRTEYILRIIRRLV